MGLDALASRMMLGTADQITAKVKEQTSGLPVTDLFIFSDYPGMSDELIERHLELTFDQLAPSLRTLG